MNIVGSGKTICPYYIREGKCSIVCMGHDEGVKEVMLLFKSKDEKKVYQNNFCFDKCYIGCAIAGNAEMRAEEES